jgi:hypothetical protein
MSKKIEDIVEYLRGYLKKEVEVQAFDMVYKGTLKRILKTDSIILKNDKEEMTLPIERIESVKLVTI